MKKTLLIVDDDLSILKLLSFILSKDYEIVVKNNGIEAFSWLEDGNLPKLIISDLQMPYFDGQSFIKECKNKRLLPQYTGYHVIGSTRSGRASG
jgi:two-component system chemotaxis response regulator CheY